MSLIYSQIFEDYKWDLNDVAQKVVENKTELKAEWET